MGFLLLIACAHDAGSDPAEGTDTGPLDLRQDYPGPTGDGVQLVTPDLHVPAYSERLFCYYGTWEGDDSAVNQLNTFQVLPYNHHNQVKAAPDNAPPDGTLAECTEEDMSGYQPFIDGVPPFDIAGGAFLPSEDGLENKMSLPDGYAVKLPHGRRWVIDTHYVNTTGREVIVNSAINLGFADPETVTNWVGVIQLDSGPPHIPPGDYNFSFDCAWPKDLQILVVSSHMHALGTSFTVDSVVGDSVNRVHEVLDWNDNYRVYPKMDVWNPGDFPVKAGDVFRTTCNWRNDSNSIVSFPDEMCTTLVVVSPLEAPLGCYNGVWRE